MKIISAVVFLMLLTLPAHLLSQTTPPENKVQKGSKTLVSVPVTVSDREGRYISGLKKEDFNLFEDGARQNIAFFATEDEPLSVALVLDSSGSTKDVLDKIKSAARDFIELLNPNDQCQIVTFDSQVRVLNPFTADKPTLFSSLDKARTATEDGTVMYSAVEQIARESFANIQGRKVIVLLSDGKDFGSPVTKDALLSRLEELDVMIYTIFYQTSATSAAKLNVAGDGTIKEEKAALKPPEKKEKEKKKKKKGYTIFIPVPGDVYTEQDVKLTQKVSVTEAVDALKQMSDATAGRFYLSDTPDLGGIFKKIAGELRQQYRLGYYTRDASDAAVRDIIVKVERADVVVRARGKFRSKPL
jgi:VWFA-related protein